MLFELAEAEGDAYAYTEGNEYKEMGDDEEGDDKFEEEIDEEDEFDEEDSKSMWPPQRYIQKPEI